MDALDSYIPQPKREIEKLFLMPVEDALLTTNVVGFNSFGTLECENPPVTRR